MPVSRRPVRMAASAWPPSCTMVTTLRDQRHTSSSATAASATTPVTTTTHQAGSSSSIVIAHQAVTTPGWHAGRGLLGRGAVEAGVALVPVGVQPLPGVGAAEAQELI